MQVDRETVARYESQAPELLDSVTSGEAEYIMKRDAETDYCVKFDQGWCSIHQDRGTDFLGDACHFFPRVTRQLGSQVLQTATLSCPEIARLALVPSTSPQFREVTQERLPFTLQNYLDDKMAEEEALSIHQSFLNYVLEDDAPVSQLIARLHSVSESLAMVDRGTWAMAVDFYLKNADNRLSTPETQAEDYLLIYQALAGLVVAAGKEKQPRLKEVLTTMKHALDIQDDAAKGGIVGIGEHTAQNINQLKEGWQFVDSQWQPFFKHWLHTQLSMALFPFSGFGNTMADRMCIIGVRYATLKLALQCHLFQHQVLTMEDAIRITQTLARFLDHLAEPELSLSIYTETGWTKTARLWGVCA